MRPVPRRLALALAALLAPTISCGGDDPVAPPPAVDRVVVTGSAELRIGETAEMRAQLLDARGRELTGRAVSWRTDPASVLSVSPGGRISGVGEGTARVIATAEGVSGELAVLVQYPRGTPGLVTVAPTHALLVAGRDLALDARVRDRSGARVDAPRLRWALDDSTLATVDAAGTVRALRPGVVTVTVTTDTLQASARLVLLPRTERLRLSPDTLVVVAGGSARFAALGIDPDGNTFSARDVVWTVLDAAVMRVEDDAVIATGAPGSAGRIVARSEERADTAVVMIAPPEADGVEIFPQAAVLRVGATSQLTARFVGAAVNVPSGTAGSWRSADERVATVNAGGLVTGRAAGTTEIVFESGALRSRIAVRVEGEPAAIEAMADTLRVSQLGSVSLDRLPVRVRDATGQAVTSFPMAASVADTNIAALRAGILLVAKADGLTSLTITAGTASLTLPLRASTSAVGGPPNFNVGGIGGVTNTALEMLIGVGGSGTRTVHLGTGDANVATVSPASVTTSDGFARITVTLVAPGTTRLYAVSPGGSDAIGVTVAAPAVHRVRILDRLTSARAGRSYALRAEVRDARQVVQPWMPAWRSTAPGVATVTRDGTLTGVAPGTTSIIAMLGERADTIALAVHPATAPVITAVQPAVLVAGETATLDGTGFSMDPSALRVTVGGVPATITAATATRLTIQLPVASAFPCTETRPAQVVVTSDGVAGDTLQPLRVARLQPLVAVGQTAQLAGRDAACIEFAPGAGRWVATIASPGTSLAQRATLRLAVTRSAIAAGAPAAVLAATESRAGGADVTLPDAAWRRDREARHREAWGVSGAVRRRAGLRALVAPPAAPAAPAGALVPGAGTVAQALAAPVEGAVVTMRVPLFTVSDFCNRYAEVKARVVAFSTRSVVLEDVDAPLAGGMDGILRALGTELETRMMSPDALLAGDPLRLDAVRGGAGRVAVLVTRAINDFGARNLVLTSGCDEASRALAPSSNEVPTIYATAPTDPASGYLSSNTAEYWSWVLRARVMHELAHLAMNAERAVRGLAPEDYWLDEALAAVHVEAYARQFGGMAWKGGNGYTNAVACEVRPTTPGCGTRPFAMFDLFAWLYEYGIRSSARSPLGQAVAGDGTFLGAGWWMLRWAIDHHATDERAFVRALVTEPTGRGMANLQARTGRPAPEMAADVGSTYLGPTLLGVVPARERMRVPSWDWAAVWGGMRADFAMFGPLPLSLKSNWGAVPWESGPFVLEGGSFETLDLRPGAQSLVVALTGSGGGAPPAGLIVQLVRQE